MNKKLLANAQLLADRLTALQASQDPRSLKISTIEVPVGKTGLTLTMPFIAKEYTTYVTPEGDKSEPILPVYIIRLREGKIRKAIDSMAIETVLLMRAGFTATIDALEAPIAVCANVRPGTFQLDFDSKGRTERIVLNEDWAADRAIDADGDRAFLIWGTEGEAFLVKWPLTKRIPLLKYVKGRAREIFYDLGKDDSLTSDGMTTPGIETIYEHHALPNWYGRDLKNTFKLYEGSEGELTCIEKEGVRYIAQDEKSAFYKSHTPVEVGLVTSALNTEELHKTLKLSFEEKLEKLYSDDKRFELIEKQQLKGARKDTHSIGAHYTYPFVLQSHLSPFLTSPNNITNNKDLSWVMNISLTTLVSTINTLALKPSHFREILPFKAKEVKRKLITVDEGLISRLINTGRLKVVSYTHKKLPYDKTLSPIDGNNLPVIAIYLTLPTGEIVALTDVKRDDGRSEGLTYCFLLPPVWDAELEKFVNPLHHMAKAFATVLEEYDEGEFRSVGRFDSRIINPATGNTVSWFGSNLTSNNSNAFRVDHFEKYEAKVAMLQEAITEYCSEYGLACNGEKTPKGVVPTFMSIDTATSSVVVDYMKDCTAAEMEEIILKANAKQRLCIAGNKQTKRRVRKYYCARKNGTPIISSPHAHIARAGKQMAQRAKSIAKVRMTTAIVLSESKTQVYITPSGIQKQATDKAFMPIPFSTEEKFEEYAKSFEVANGEAIKPKIIISPTWRGKLRKIWVADARATIEIGKLIDDNGMKYMPRRIEQFTYQDADGEHNIDQLVPIVECLDKGALRALLGNEVPTHYVKTIRRVVGRLQVSAGSAKHNPELGPIHEVLEYEEYEAIVFEGTFYRSGSASENVTARNGKARLNGLDKFSAFGELRKKLNIELPTPDLELPIWLQDCMKFLNKIQ